MTGLGSGREALVARPRQPGRPPAANAPGADQWHIVGLKVAPFQQLLTRRNGRRRGRMRRGRRVGRGQHGVARDRRWRCPQGAPENATRGVYAIFGL